MPDIAKAIDGMGLPDAVAKGLEQIAATALGAAVGGTAGVVSGVNVEANNRQLHPDEKTWIKSNAERYAAQKGISVDQAQQELTAQAGRQTQFGSPGAWDQNASAFLSQAGHGLLPAEGNIGPGYMFYATPDQKANPNMYAGYGGTNNPSAADLVAAISRNQAIRKDASNATLAAAGVAGTIAGAGPLVAISGTPIFSSGGALGSSMWASPLGTGAISVGINAGAQYYQNGAINPVDVAIAAASGGAGVYGGLLWNMAVNATGGASGAALNNYFYGLNNNVVNGGISSGVLSGFGYGIGKFSESIFNSAIKPTINTSNCAGTGVWDSGGWNLFKPNAAGVILGTAAAGSSQEISGAAVQNLPSVNGKKK